MTDEAQEPTTVGVVGALGTDPELRYSKAGKPFSKFRLAVTRPVVAGDWRGDTTTDWYEIVAFGSLAENVATALQKGDRAVVTGRYELQEWSNGQGFTAQIIADGIGADLRFNKKGD